MSGGQNDDMAVDSQGPRDRCEGHPRPGDILSGDCPCGHLIAAHSRIRGVCVLCEVEDQPRPGGGLVERLHEVFFEDPNVPSLDAVSNMLDAVVGALLDGGWSVPAAWLRSQKW